MFDHLQTAWDQGSVESQNKLVKRVLMSTNMEKCLSGENSNWTMLLANMMATNITVKGRMRYSVKPYKAVTGLDFHGNFSCTKEEA